MNKPTLYEQVGIIIPGALFLIGAFALLPELRTTVGSDGVSLGEFGIFFLLAYASGHFVAAVGNFGELFLWGTVGGMPSDWIVKPETTLISHLQRQKLDERIRSRLGIDIATTIGMDRKVWRPISRQLYADVMRNGKPDRIDVFNGNYGLNRGLCAASLVLIVVALSQQRWVIAVAFLVATIVFGYRAYRFGVHYGRELYVQFLSIE
jgi:hypothetical protein